MSKIQLLDDRTINQIAAGEVVERPLSVIKELTENALDAGATSLVIEATPELLLVSDNGSGIEPEDIRTAFLRHATSKIRTADDLLKVVSLGFRGEALASIASVAHVELFTKTAGAECGVHYVIEGGRELVYEEAACPEGTTLRVENLFYNVPARREFLKKPSVEIAAITEYVQHLILAHPDVSIRYFIGKSNAQLVSNGSGDLRTAIFSVYGRDTVDKLLELPSMVSEDGMLGISGYISRPQLVRPSKGMELFFVNGRPIHSALLENYLTACYRDFVVPQTYPVAVIKLAIHPSLVDVNVHPGKLEVRFRNEEALHELFCGAVDQALASTLLVHQVTNTPPEEMPTKPEKTEIPETPVVTEKPTEVAPAPYEAAPEETKPEEAKPVASKTEVSQVTLFDPHKDETSEAKSAVLYETAEEEKPASVVAEDFPRTLRLIGQLFDTYWLAEGTELGINGKTKKTLYIMDQHAAHERVMYEHFRELLLRGEVGSQLLLVPQVYTVSPKLVASLPEMQETLLRMGFEAEAFGEDAVIVRALPFIFNNTLGEADFRELLELMDTGSRRAGAEMMYEKLAMTACKAAVKGNSLMSVPEAEKLLDELFACENPYNCPHGRPTLISFSQYELERLFKRV